MIQFISLFLYIIKELPEVDKNKGGFNKQETKIYVDLKNEYI